MDRETRANGIENEIAEIENRRGKRNLFMTLGGIVAAFLLVVVVVGARERARLAEIEARPTTEPLEVGTYIGTASNQAVFARGEQLVYIEGIGEAEITSDTRFVREITYNPAGEADTVASSLAHWSLAASDSLPYVIEPVTNPLMGVNPTEYQELELGSMQRQDYGTGGPGDWQPLEREGTNVQVTGDATRVDNAVYLVADSIRARLQGIEGLTPLDSLEVSWATESGAPLTAYGRITNTPQAADAALFVLTLNAIQPAASVAEGAPAAADTTAAAADTTAAGTTGADTTGP